MVKTMVKSEVELAKTKHSLREGAKVVSDEIRDQVKRLEVDLAEALREQFVITQERVLTDKQVEQKLWKVWSYVRDNMDAMDSVRVCNHIRSLIYSVTGEVQKRLEVSTANANELHTEVKRLNGQLRKERKAITKLRDKVIELEEKATSIQELLVEKFGETIRDFFSDGDGDGEGDEKEEQREAKVS